MATDRLLDPLRESERALEMEIAGLRDDLLVREEALANLQKSIHALEKGHTVDGSGNLIALKPSTVRTGRSRPSLSKRAGHYDHILYNGLLCEDAAQCLDHIGVPHYFSRVPGMTGRGDESQRQILAWARKNPGEARKVLLVYSDGSKTSLWDFMVQMGWA